MYSYLASYLPKGEIEALRVEMGRSTPNKGFIVNKQRISLEKIKEQFPQVRQDTENPTVFRYDMETVSPGKSILHEGGAFYIADPSAFEAIANLGFNNRKLVLDLCAAPGGKTIAYALNNPDSLIIANDISRLRAEELSKNIERLGLANVICTSLDPSFFSSNLSGVFDLVILDAPCSGTGMFRKEAKMEDDWSYDKTLRLTPIQDSLLKTAASLIRPGGQIIYLTCSFLKEEDEDRISEFLSNNSSFSIHQLKIKETYYQGTLPFSIHLFPTHFQGEGHFFQILDKVGEGCDFLFEDKPSLFSQDHGLYETEILKDKWGLTHSSHFFSHLPFLRLGVKLTDTSQYAKSPFDHALSHWAKPGLPQYELDSEQAKSYLRGEESKGSLKDGIYVASYEGLGLGLVSVKGGRIRNLYPKGLRRSL